MSAGRGIAIRPMTAIDVARVGEIDKRAFGQGAWPERAFVRELQTNRVARYFVLDPGGGRPLAAYLGCWVLPGELHIVTVAVDPEDQRGGLGEALVQHALDVGYETGADSVTLECRESNAAAQALYRKYQFRQVGRRRRYYRDTNEDAIILTAHGISGPDYRASVERLRAQHRSRHGLSVTVAVG